MKIKWAWRPKSKGSIEGIIRTEMGLSAQDIVGKSKRYDAPGNSTKPMWWVLLFGQREIIFLGENKEEVLSFLEERKRRAWVQIPPLIPPWAENDPIF